MIRLTALVAVLLTACTATKDEGGTYDDLSKVCTRRSENPEYVSIAALLSDPDRFEGRVVGIRGYVHFSFEHRAIYFSQADYQNQVVSNGLWVEGPMPPEINDEYASLVGVFTAKSKGHLDNWSGTICGITRVVGSRVEP